MESKVRESELKSKLKSYIPFWAQKILYRLIKKFRLAKNYLNLLGFTWIKIYASAIFG